MIAKSRGILVDLRNGEVSAHGYLSLEIIGMNFIQAGKNYLLVDTILDTLISPHTPRYKKLPIGAEVFVNNPILNLSHQLRPKRSDKNTWLVELAEYPLYVLPTEKAVHVYSANGVYDSDLGWVGLNDGEIVLSRIDGGTCVSANSYLGVNTNVGVRRNSVYRTQK